MFGSRILKSGLAYFVTVAVLTGSGCRLHYSNVSYSINTDNAVPAVQQSVTLFAENGEFSAIRLNALGLDPSRVHLTESTSGQVVISATVAADSVGKLAEFRNSISHAVPGTELVVAMGNNQHYGCGEVGSGSSLRVTGFCFVRLDISLPRASRTQIYVNRSPVRIDLASLEEYVGIVANQAFDSNKVEFTRNALASGNPNLNSISVALLTQILRNFSFDEYRVEMIQAWLPRLEQGVDRSPLLSTFVFESYRAQAGSLLQ